MLDKIGKFSLPELEERVLRFWSSAGIFNQAEKKNEGKKDFVFYEGPPTANGRPGIHHVLSRSFKDVMLRYKTMRGFNVFRRGGWDTHGLPVELEVEKKLGLKSKKDIEAYGIAEFNKKCKESVWSYKEEWEKLTERIGFWIDLKHPYITYENSYIESIWWIISRLAKKNLLYKAHKVVPWCPRCGTALSSHELAQGYREVKETSLYVKFKIKKNQEAGVPLGARAYIISWTTTPWTLPANVALAVGAKINYLVLEEPDSREIYIIAEKLADKVLGSGYKVLAKIKGEDLEGLKYTPLFSIKAFGPYENKGSAYKIYTANFVSTEEGTGVVHTAVMYGEDDYRLGQKVGLPQIHTVDESGRFNKLIPFLTGLFVKSKEAESKIINYLERKGNLLKKEDYTHDYPFCWRCETPVLYYARNSWFIKINKLRKKLLKANSRINWVPSHIKGGRFGEWLRNAKDWAISRERYWGTPLPIWECSRCGRHRFIESFKELSSASGGSRNKYILMRHGEAESNAKSVINSDPKKINLYGLTLKGRVQAEQAAFEIKKEGKVDLIFSSDFRRTKETAEIVGNILGAKVLFDKRLREINTGEFDGKPEKSYKEFFDGSIEKFSKTPKGGENLRELARRIWDFISYLESKYEGKTILIVSHEHSLWMAETVMRGWGEENSAWQKDIKPRFFELAEVKKVELLNLPRNEWGLADVHRPYIDKVTFSCKCGGKMKKIPEVIDVWFDSGAMPFAQFHYPFVCSKTHTRPQQCIKFPADYITEGIDQTRGWFYTLLAISVLLGEGAPYLNVVSLELVLDKYGRKMSKSKGNVVDPWQVADKFGADVVRWYFYTASAPGEPKRFDEKELEKILRGFIFIIYNSFVFFKTYNQSKISLKDKPSIHILDKWIIARLKETAEGAKKKMDKYDITGAARGIDRFVDDLSRWYIRRSRDRFQNPSSKKEFREASYTLAVVLLELSKIIAPFVPFISEALYQSLKKEISGYKFKNSVHLEDWPKFPKVNITRELLDMMEKARKVASVALAEREKAGIKVRQPLAKLKVSADLLSEKEKQIFDILREEVNVKKVEIDKRTKNKIELDTKITHQLKEEGWMREIVRIVQQMRRDAGLLPQDKIELGYKADEELGKVIRDGMEFFGKKVGAEAILPKLLRKYDLKKETRIDNRVLDLTLRKIKRKL